MNPYRDGIVAPGVRDNDWAHTSYDDMYFARTARVVGRHAQGVAEGAWLAAGRPVYTLAGEPLGEVLATVLDATTGRVAYAVLACRDAAIGAGKLYAIPSHALRYDAGGDCHRVDVTRERLQAAPAFERDRWPPAADDRQWARDVDAYWE